MMARVGGTLLHCWWQCKLVQSLWKSVWRLLTKLKIELPYDPGIPLLGISKGTKSAHNRLLHTHVYCSAIHNSQLWNQPRCPSTDEWIKKT
jgi:hypothetical protein